MATVYLSPTGSDSNTYAQAQSPSTPWLTPGKVQSAATTGDSVVMAAGTYTFASITFTKSFTWTGAALASNVPTTIIQQSSNNQTWVANAVGNTQSFSNIMIRNGINSAATVFSLASAAVWTFANCILKNMQISSGNSLWDGTSAASLIFSYCAFDDIYAADATTSFGRIIPPTMTGCSISFRTTSPGAVRYIFNGITGGALKNCIIRNSTGGTVTWNNGTVTTTATYCDFYNITSSPAGTGNITSDPLFVDESNSNLLLRPTSPCIDTGVIP